MYQRIFDQLNDFLTQTLLVFTPLNPDAFQGVFIKKLSNQNIVREKRRISARNTASTVNQTHLDVTGRDSMLFFFETLNDQTTTIQGIDIDLYCNNYAYLKEINSARPQKDNLGNTSFVRLAYGVPRNTLGKGDDLLHSLAYKKYGHTGSQVQINMPDSREKFSVFHSLAFLDDALVFLKYDYTHYLALLIPARKFRNRRVQIFSVAGLFMLPVLGFFNKNTDTVTQIVATTEATSTVGSSTTAGYTIGYFLQDPLAFVSMMTSTLTDKLGFYLQSVVGQKMGWVEIEISEAIPILFLLLLALSVCKEQREPVFVKTWQKWWVTLVCGASFGIILVGMLLTWTPMGNVSIEGVQGRYLIPLLPAFALVGRNRLLMYEKNPERGLVYAAFVGQLLTVMYLIKAVLVIR